MGSAARDTARTSFACTDVRDARPTSAVPEGFPPNKQIDNPVFSEYATVHCHCWLRSELNSHQAGPPNKDTCIACDWAMLTPDGLNEKKSWSFGAHSFFLTSAERRPRWSWMATVSP